MIRLSYPDMTHVFEFKENIVNTLIIENPDFLRAFISDISAQLAGFNGKTVLSKDYTPIEIAKNLDLVTQIIPFEVNKKALISRICSRVSKIAVDEAHFSKTNELMSSIERYIDELLFEFPYSLQGGAPEISAIIKAVGISVDTQDGSDTEKLLDYMELVREFDGDKLFVFVNMRSFFSIADISAFFDSVIDRKLNALFIDSICGEKIGCEKRILIDNDLCEIF